MNILAGTCWSNSPALNETVDDVLIFVTLDSIDGPGNDPRVGGALLHPQFQYQVLDHRPDDL